jgi:HSP20 family protein
MFVRVQSRPVFRSPSTSRWMFTDPMGELVSDFFRSEQPSGVASRPAIDLAEYENEYRLVAEMPGMKKEDVKVTLEDGHLILSGERSQAKPEEGTRVLLQEIGARKFTRAIHLPDDVDVNKISADLVNGVLTVGLPKQEHARPREITIR